MYSIGIKDILARELEAIKKELIERYDELGMRASGSWEKELVVSVEEKGGMYLGKIEGADYTYYMQHGRGAGRLPPIKAIEEWIQNKGIVPIERNMKVSSLAFAIANRIAKEGTRRYQRGGTPAFIEEVITSERIQGIIDRIGERYIAGFSSEIIELLENIGKAA